MNQLMKRVLSVLLVVCLLCSALPSAFAAEGGGCLLYTSNNRPVFMSAGKTR